MVILDREIVHLWKNLDLKCQDETPGTHRGTVREEVLRRSIPRMSFRCVSSRNQLWVEDKAH